MSLKGCGYRFMIKLPIELDPILKTYQNTALPFSALMAQNTNAVVFAINNFSHLYCDNDSLTKFNFYYPWFRYWDIIDVHSIIRSDYIENLKISIIDYIKDSINNGGYVYTTVNEYYVPHRKAHMKYNYEHDILVHGYDDQHFYILGYDENGHYRETPILQKDFQNAYKTTFSRKYTISFTSATYNKYVIDEKLNCNFISDYILSKNSFKRFPFSESRQLEFSWGINAVKKMMGISEQYFINEHCVDIRYFDVYCQHIKLMKLRIEKIIDSSQSIEYLNKYDEIFRKARIIKNLAIKTNLTGSKSVFDELINFINNIIDAEKNTLESILMHQNQL